MKTFCNEALRYVYLIYFYNRPTLVAFLTIYYAHVHLSYARPITLWANCGYSVKVLVLQRRAICFMSGVPPRTHCKPLFSAFRIVTMPSLYVFLALLYIRENLPIMIVNLDVVPCT